MVWLNCKDEKIRAKQEKIIIPVRAMQATRRTYKIQVTGGNMYDRDRKRLLASEVSAEQYHICIDMENLLIPWVIPGIGIMFRKINGFFASTNKYIKEWQSKKI